MTVADESVPDNRVLEWAHILRQCRVDAGYDYHKVADHCGVARSLVRDWENGVAIPNHQTLKRLHGLLRRLEYHKDLLPRPKPIVNTPEPELLKAPLFAIVEAHRRPAPQLPPQPPAPKPEPPPQKEPVVLEQPKKPDDLLFPPRTFGGALEALRKKYKYRIDEFAKLMDVSTGTVYRWEADGYSPVRKHYEQLINLIPELKQAPQPDSKNWQIPTGGVNRAPDEPQPMPVKPQQQLTAMKGVAELATAYGQALSKAARLKERVDQLTLQTLEAEEELKRANTEVENAHDALKKATGGGQ